MRHYDVAYIVNHYPKVSHSFIRREIIELENLGLNVLRISMRGWRDDLVDPMDLVEREKTVFVLKAGPWALLGSMLAESARAPRKFLTALAMAVRMMRRSDRPAPWHIIYLAEACWISGPIRQHRIRHLHAHFGTNPAEVAALASILTGTTFSFTVHGPEEFDKAHSLHLAEKVERAAFVVAISSFCRSQLYRVTRYAEWEKIKVVHCGLDNEFTSLEQEPPPAASKFVCVGRLCEQKGQLLLVEAMAELMAEFPELELVLVGDGEMRSEIEALIDQHGVGRSIRITGWATAEQVKQQILDARAMILPSFAEGLPVVLMEAMALKRPVLTTMINGIPELVINEETGWLVPAGSKSDLKDAVRKCLTMPMERLVAMGHAARQRVLERHSAESQAQVLISEFHRFVAAATARDAQPPTG